MISDAEFEELAANSDGMRDAVADAFLAYAREQRQAKEAAEIRRDALLEKEAHYRRMLASATASGLKLASDRDRLKRELAESRAVVKKVRPELEYEAQQVRQDEWTAGRRELAKYLLDFLPAVQPEGSEPR